MTFWSRLAVHPIGRKRHHSIASRILTYYARSTRQLCSYHQVPIQEMISSTSPPAVPILIPIFALTFKDMSLQIDMEYDESPPKNSLDQYLNCKLCNTPTHVLDYPLELAREQSDDIPQRPRIYLNMPKRTATQWEQVRRTPRLFRLKMKSVAFKVMLESFVRCATCEKDFGLLDCLATYVNHKVSGECDTRLKQ